MGKKHVKGQAALEALLILSAVLTVAAGYMYTQNDSSRPIYALSAAQTGAENAANRLNLQYKTNIEIEDISRNNDTININLNFWGGDASESLIESSVENDALKFLYQAFRGDFPDAIGPVSVGNHTFDVQADAERVKK